MARVRRIVAALVATAAVLTVAGCGSGGTADAPTFAPRPTTGLASLLEAPPKYSDPGTSEWARTYSPSTAQFVGHLYAEPVRKRITAALARQKLQDIAHILWITDDDIQSDIVVLRFADYQGAAERFDFAQTTNNGNGELGSYSIDSPGAPIVYYDNQPKEKGFKIAKAYARVNTYVIEMFVYAPGEIPRMQIERWMRAQVARLT